MTKIEILKTLEENKGQTFAIHFSENIITGKVINCTDNEIIIDGKSYKIEHVTRITVNPNWGI